MVSLLAVALPTSIPSLSTNLIIIAAVVLVAIYGVVAGHAALVRESVSIYVGLVLASAFGAPAYSYLHKSAGGSLHITQTIVQLLLLLVPVLLLQFGRRHTTAHHKHNLIITGLLAVLAAMLLVSSVLNQLNPVMLSHVTDESPLASWAYDFRLAWLAAVPLAIAASALFKPKEHNRHH